MLLVRRVLQARILYYSGLSELAEGRARTCYTVYIYIAIYAVSCARIPEDSSASISVRREAKVTIAQQIVGEAFPGINEWCAVLYI